MGHTQAQAEGEAFPPPPPSSFMPGAAYSLNAATVGTPFHTGL